MDQEPQQDGQEKKQQYIEIFIEKMNEYFKGIDFNEKRERTAVILFGKTRVGKSTIFHILKGDELQKIKKGKLDLCQQGQKENFIGLSSNSTTKFPNIFSFQKNVNGQLEQIDIIDTPGFDDNQNQFDDMIRQIQQQKLYKSYKKVILLIVAQFISDNKEYYLKPFELVQNLFQSQDDIDFLLSNSYIAFIKFKRYFSHLPPNQLQIESVEEDLQEDINAKDDQNQIKVAQYKIQKQFLQHMNMNLYMLQKCAEKHQQDQFKDKIYNFINQDRKQTEILNYKLSLTKDGLLFSQNILKVIEEIFQKELSNSISSFIKYTEGLGDLQTQEVDVLRKQRDSFQELLKLLPEQLHLHSLGDIYYQRLNDYFAKLNYKEFNAQDLEKYKFFFQEKIIENLLLILREVSNDRITFQITLADNRDQIWTKITLIQEQIVKKTTQTEREANIQNSIEQSIKDFENYFNWNKLLVFIGNPLSGKSTSINLLYNCMREQMHFHDSLMYIHFSKIQYDEIVTFAQQSQDLIIEFQQFSEDYVVLLHYFLTFCLKKNKAFSLQIVLDENPLNQNIQQGLKKFMDLNSIQNIQQLNIILNLKQGSNYTQKIELELLDPIIQSPNYKKIYIMDKEFKQDTKMWDNSQIFQNLEFLRDEKIFLEISKSFNEKLIYLIEQFNKKSYNIIINSTQLQNSIEELQLVVKLSKLNPRMSQQLFKYKIRKIISIIPLNEIERIIDDDSRGNHTKLKDLIKILLQEWQLLLAIQKVSLECQSKIDETERIIQNFTFDNDFNKLDQINLLIESLNIHDQFLKINEKESLSRLKLFFQLFYNESQQSHNLEQNQIDNKRDRLLQQIQYYQYELKNLTKKVQLVKTYLKQTSYRGYNANDYYFPFSIFHGSIWYYLNAVDNAEVMQFLEIENQQQNLIQLIRRKFQLEFEKQLFFLF